MLICRFCGRECKNTNSLRNHERLCKENPNRSNFPGKYKIGKKGGNQYTKAIELGLPKPKISEDTRKKLSDISSKKRHNENTKKKLSEIAKKNGLGGVTQSRWIKYNGKTLGSSYELKLVQSLDENNIRWDVCKRFNYIDPIGKVRTYTPDIYLIDFNVYLDPKNDFLINNVNPSLGFSDIEKIRLVMIQNNIKIIILNKDQLEWQQIKALVV